MTNLSTSASNSVGSLVSSTWSTDTRTMTAETLPTFEPITNYYSNNCPSNYKITAQPSSPKNYNYHVKKTQHVATITGWTVETGCSDAFLFVLKYDPGTETYTLPSIISSTTKGSNQVVIRAHSTDLNDAGKKFTINIYPRTYNSQSANTIVYNLYTWYITPSATQTEFKYIITTPEKTINVPAYTTYIPPGNTETITYSITY